MSRGKISYGQAPESLVVGLARNGDAEAFAELVRRRQSWIRNLMRRSCRDVTLADDLAQTVFLAAWRNIRHLQQPDRFAGWLKRLAINTWLQHMRRNDALGDTDELDGTEMPRSDTTGIAVDLDRALATLPAVQRLCVVLSYHEGMSHSEISDHTGLPAGTVKSHIRRGSQQLRQLLSAYKSVPGAKEDP